ncbi:MULTISPECIES: SMP-30/gluconolactonase/LRE family protein [Paraburkholderia]|uniref:SMP-30/gluconolactonase/LRE family protein n=1 Tax=Paraburkholderia madseniana TaxID=2599607 RepID=A0AAP5BL54_9BURK|nr:MULTISPECIES: SMP-30/gluconolactonase/LRE family protein [Paraburkholderia]MCX4149981.1 SMP-30/gluconolactonase/LRE family protein [Paraburkholderia madseniana]MDN7152917.1 SMP-30/gluconolactonase/LRE family protein [Paraburkholderia sp. WS6]MDQ6411799.1 SMP-30/gluconolactonase/LRE family protein [Paraburkholderia madseniana]
MAPIEYSSTLEVVFNPKMEVGEGPIWDDATSTLLFVESFNGAVHRYDPMTGKLLVHYLNQPVGIAIPRKRGGLVVSARDGLLSVQENDPDADLLVPLEFEKRGNRMNDAKCDSLGRLWSGTFSTTFEPKAGSLYCIDPNYSVTKAAEGVYISNGIAWSPDETKMYYADTAKRGVDVFDYDIHTGGISNRRRFVNIDRADGLPDGMATDAQGYLWVALYCGGVVRRYSPEGEWVGTVTLPVAGVTSCGFGGKDLQDLYITTANHLPAHTGLIPEPGAGALFRCRPGIAGMPVYPFGG